MTIACLGEANFGKKSEGQQLFPVTESIFEASGLGPCQLVVLSRRSSVADIGESQSHRYPQMWFRHPHRYPQIRKIPETSCYILDEDQIVNLCFKEIYDTIETS